MKNEMTVTLGCLYRAKGSDEKFIVTGVGLDNILFAPMPLVKLNGTYIEHCKPRSQFQKSFSSCELMEVGG